MLSKKENIITNKNMYTDVLKDGAQMCYNMDKLQMAVLKVKVSESRQ